MADAEKRVVLVKPGDLLLIGNAPHAASRASESMEKLFDHLNIKVVVFADDITLDALPAEATGGGA